MTPEIKSKISHIPEARYFQLPGREAEVPEDGYHGEDLVETMEHLVSRDRYLMPVRNFCREMLVELP